MRSVTHCKTLPEELAASPALKALKHKDKHLPGVTQVEVILPWLGRGLVTSWNPLQPFEVMTW